MKQIYSLEEVDQIAEKVIQESHHKILLFYGEMGAGKTTLIKSICKQLQSEDTISSPTFSLVNEYRTTDNKLIYHFDFYRIEDEEEALDMGIEDYFDNDAWCLVEWPENIENLLPLESVKIHLSYADHGKRSIQLIQP